MNTLSINNIVQKTDWDYFIIIVEPDQGKKPDCDSKVQRKGAGRYDEKNCTENAERHMGSIEEKSPWCKV